MTGLPVEKVIDFSSNVSPLPLPEQFLQALGASMGEISHLPEVDCRTLREDLARKYGLSSDWFVVNSGTTPFIYSLPRNLAAEKVVTLLPTYSDYADGAKRAGIAVEGVQVIGEELERPDVESLLSALLSACSGGSSLLFVCNPNNPDGYFIPPPLLARFCEEVEQETVVVVDESYTPFVGPEEETSMLPYLPGLENLVVLRSFSKIFGVPGLRLGALCANPFLASRAAMDLLPWAVGSLAQHAGRLLLKMDDFAAEARRYCQSQRRVLIEGIAKLEGLVAVEGQAHFFIVEVEKGAGRLWDYLARRGILVRHCGNFHGLPRRDKFIRISPRLERENRDLLSCIREFCGLK